MGTWVLQRKSLLRHSHAEFNVIVCRAPSVYPMSTCGARGTRRRYLSGGLDSESFTSKQCNKSHDGLDGGYDGDRYALGAMLLHVNGDA